MRHDRPTTGFIRFPREDLEQSIPARFEQQVQLYPTRLAVKTREHTLSYLELSQSANRIAAAVLEASGDDEAPVALLFDQGALLVSSILAALKAGKIYVPLDPADSRERLDFMLGDSGAGLILTDECNHELARTLVTSRRRMLNAERIGPRELGRLPRPVAPQHPAYIYYTSGSTGEPKGVFDSHRNVLHNIMRYTNNLKICADDRLTLLQSCAFSGSVSNLFCALLNGAAVFPIELRNEGIDGLAQWLIQEQITIYHSVPSIFQQLMAVAQHFPSLRIIRLEGDQSALRHVQLYQQHFDQHCVLVNGFGATETGITRQFFMHPHTKLPGAGVPIGYALEDMETLLLDASGVEVARGEVGEISVRSRYLACGYWRKPELTRAAFRACAQDPEQRIFHTGDLGRMLPDGCLEHLGRKDFRVKIMGQWAAIPLIEAALSAIAGIGEGIVAAHDEGYGPRLTGYVVPSVTPPPTVSAMQMALAAKLPGYMVPSTYVMLEALPLDSNGKVDRRSLSPPSPLRPALDTPYIAARNQTEEEIATIWSQVLKIPEVGVHDTFLELGGNSLQAMMIVNRIGDAFELHLPPSVLFEAPTVAKMAQVLAASNTSECVTSRTNGQKLASLPLSDHIGRSTRCFAAGRIGPENR
jgi:amino acid adenylation domain-containing protein